MYYSIYLVRIKIIIINAYYKNGKCSCLIPWKLPVFEIFELLYLDYPLQYWFTLLQDYGNLNSLDITYILEWKGHGDIPKLVQVTFGLKKQIVKDSFCRTFESKVILNLHKV